MAVDVQLAVNYSQVAVRLIERGAIAVDLFKCPTDNDLIVAAEVERPVFVHGDLWIGSGTLDEACLQEWAKFARVGATRWLNVHFAPQTDGSTRTGSVDARREAIRDRSARDLKELIRRYSRQRVAVENVPWERRSDFPIDVLAVDPGLLTEVVESAGVGFILDLAHTRMAALELQIDPWELIDGYPTSRLVELHVAGIAVDQNGRLRDSMPMSEEDWLLVDRAIRKISDREWPVPLVIALEYGGEGDHFSWRTDEGDLERQFRRLQETVSQRVPR